MGIIIIMELYDFAALTTELGTTWYNEMKNAQGKFTCQSVEHGWKAWNKKVKKSSQWKNASKKKRYAYMMGVFKKLMAFDAKHKCGWKAKWAAYCHKKDMKFSKFVKKVKASDKYNKATKAQRKAFWKKVAWKVAKFLWKSKCHKVNKNWGKRAAFLKAMWKKHHKKK